MTAVDEAREAGRFATLRHETFSALSIPNFRLYFAGQSISLVGTWMQMVAQAWLVLEITGSATWVGLTVAAQTLPILLVGPYGGLVADRTDKRRLLIGLPGVMGALAARAGRPDPDRYRPALAGARDSLRCSAWPTPSRSPRGSRSSSRSSDRSPCATPSA